MTEMKSPPPLTLQEERHFGIPSTKDLQPGWLLNRAHGRPVMELPLNKACKKLSDVGIVSNENFIFLSAFNYFYLTCFALGAVITLDKIR